MAGIRIICTHLEPIRITNIIKIKYFFQTSEQLPNAALRKAAYQLALKKQIIEKQKTAEKNKLKELEEDEKLEREIAEYNERMRQQVESERANLNKLDHHSQVCTTQEQQLSNLSF